MRVFRVHQRTICTLAVWLLIAQALVAGHMPMHEAVSVKDPVLGELIICTSRAPGQSTKQLPAKPRHKPQCPCCMSGCISGSPAGTIPVALRTLAVVVRPSFVAAFPAPIETASSYIRLTTSHPRAPPSLIG
jgi:hypothetical protein